MRCNVSPAEAGAIPEDAMASSSTLGAFVRARQIVAKCMLVALTSLSFEPCLPQVDAPVPTKSHQPAVRKAVRGGTTWVFDAEARILGTLNLRHEQRERVKALNEQTKAKLRQLAKDRTAHKEPISKKGEPTALQKLMKAHQDSLIAILNADQKAKFQKDWSAAIRELRSKARPNPILQTQPPSTDGKRASET